MKGVFHASVIVLAVTMAAPVLAQPPLSLRGLEAAEGECFIIARLDGGEPVIAGTAKECALRAAPASTFKIPHALIALQSGVITPATVMQWDGSKGGFASWQRDHTLDSAIKSSVLPFFQRTATAIGRGRMVSHLRAMRYGSDTFDGEQTTFWINGDLVVSPREQIAFLRRMFTYQISIDRPHVEIVKQALLMPAGKISNAAGLHDFPLRWTAPLTVHAKTGNTAVNGERVSWLVGEVESGRSAHVFAARVRSSTRPLGTTAGADLALRGLNAVVR